MAGRSWLLAILMLVALSACGEAGSSRDAGDVDAKDASVEDAEPADAAPADAAPADAAPADAATADAGALDASPIDSGLPDAAAIDAGVADTGLADAEPPDIGPTDAEPPEAGIVDASTDAGVDGGWDAGPDSGLHACAPQPGQLPVGRFAVIGDHMLALSRPDPSVQPTACETLSYRWSEPTYAELRSDGTLYYPVVGMIDEWPLDPPIVSGTSLTASFFGACYPHGLSATGTAFVDMDLVTGQVMVSLFCQDGFVGACTNTAVSHDAFGFGTLECDRPDGGVPDAGPPLDGGDNCYYPTMRPPEGGYQIDTDFETCSTFPGCTQSCSTVSAQGALLEIEGELPSSRINVPMTGWPTWQISSVSSSSPPLVALNVRSPSCDNATGFTSWGTITVDTTTGLVDGDLVCTQSTPNGCPTDPVRHRFTFQGAYVANLDAVGCWQGQLNYCQSGCASFGSCGAPCLP